MAEIIRTEPALGDLDAIACDAPVALSALPFFLRLPRAALGAETGPSLALGYFDIAPSALNPERRSHKWPNSSELQATPLQIMLIFGRASFIFASLGQVTRASTPLTSRVSPVTVGES